MHHPKNDEKILAVTSREKVAAEVHCRHLCYKNNITKPACVTESSTELDESYISLFKYIRTDVIPNIMIVQVTSLTAELLSFVKSSEISESMKNIHR